MREATRPERVRAFIALAPPPAALEAITAWQRGAIGGHEELRAISPRSLHITLAFLGDCDHERIERARAALARATARPSPVRVRLTAAPIGLPRRRPRVVAFAADSPAATKLHEDLMARLGNPTAGGRAFRPHLSVARIRGQPPQRRARNVVAELAPLAERTGHTFDAVRVALYRSQLRSQGAHYSVLADVDLPRSGG